MKNLFHSFSNIILIFKENGNNEAASQLEKIYTGLKTSGSKILSAAEHIDHYIHDILDFTVLSDDKKLF
jgi:hypothetical protein